MDSGRRAVGAAVMYVPYPMFTPLIRPCPVVVTLHDCAIESNVDFAGGWCRQTVLRVSTSVVPEQVSLVIVGPFDHSFPNPLPKLIDDLGLVSRVVMVPSVPGRTLTDLLSSVAERCADENRPVRSG
jgi:hypothetical protein